MSPKLRAVIFAVIIIAGVTISIAFGIRLLSNKSSYALSLDVLDPNGNPVKNATIYVFSLSPKGPDPLIGIATTNSRGFATLNVANSAKFKEVIKEWRELGEKLKMGHLFKVALWITVAYPGGISTGYTVLYDPFNTSFNFPPITIRLPKPPTKDLPKPALMKLKVSEKVNNSLSEGLSQWERYSLNDVWLPLFCIQSMGDVHVAASVSSLPVYPQWLSTRGGFALSPPVPEPDLNSTPPKVLGISEVTYQVRNKFLSAPLSVWANGTASLYIYAKVKYVEKKWIVEMPNGSKYCQYEEDAYVVSFLPEDLRHSNEMKCKSVERFPPSLLGNNFIEYGTYTGKGYVEHDKNWVESLVELGGYGSVPVILESDVAKKAYSQEFLQRFGLEVGIPVGSVLASLVTPKFAPRSALASMSLAISSTTPSQPPFMLFFQVYSDAPSDIKYQVYYLVSHEKYLLQSSFGEPEKSQILMGIVLRFVAGGSNP